MSSPRPVVLSDATRAILERVATATLTSQLQRRGYQNCFLAGLSPLTPGRRMIGYAHTLRYGPLRPDLKDLLGVNHQRAAIEAIEPDDVLVIDARNETGAGTIGDIYATRVHVRGGVGIITDGALRDTPAIAAIGIPVYHRASHAAVLGRLHTPLDRQVPIACAGVTVVPGDVIVGDDEGAVVIPAALVDEVAVDAAAMEDREDFALERVQQGATIEGYFPLGDEHRAEFEAWLAARDGEENAGAGS